MTALDRRSLSAHARGRVRRGAGRHLRAFALGRGHGLAVAAVPGPEAVAEAMRRAVREATPDAQLALIRAHPELAGHAAVQGELTPDSTREQSGAGLDQCSPAEFRRLTELNRAYGERFGFPFIIAVRGHTRASVIASMEERLRHTPDEERAEALRQIDRIASLRLERRLA